MYRVDRNNFYTAEKKATVYTPEAVSKFIFSIINKKIEKKGLILDPCVGAGSLLHPFINNGYRTIGIDIENQGFSDTIVKNYLELQKGDIKQPDLVIMNPPFNLDQKTKEYIKIHYSGRPLLPEIWLMKTIELWGKGIPIVMFTPYGFRLNQTVLSQRWKKFVDGTYPEIKTIISLPKNIFEGVLFHSEILIFNIKGLKGHYFYG